MNKKIRTKTKFVGWFGLSCGCSMIFMWATFLGTGNVPEIQTKPWSISFHLVAEFITAVLLMGSGVGLLVAKQKKQQLLSRELFLFASGMLVYTCIQSPGYFLQKGEWAFLVLFGSLLILSGTSTTGILIDDDDDCLHKRQSTMAEGKHGYLDGVYNSI